MVALLANCGKSHYDGKLVRRLASTDRIFEPIVVLMARVGDATMTLEEVRRVRMVLKDRLAFLPGYPVRQDHGAVLWMPAPRAESVVVNEPMRISSNELRRAVWGWKSATAELIDGLPDVVDDVEGWTNGVPIILDLLKRSIHLDAVFPTSPFTCGFSFCATTVSRAETLARAHEVLRPLINTLAWSTCLAADKADVAISWVADEATCLQHILTAEQIPDRLNLALFLFELDADQPQRHLTRPLLRVLGHRNAFHFPTALGNKYVTRWVNLLNKASRRSVLRDWTVPERPPAFATEMFSLIQWLATCGDRRFSERALCLCRLVLPEDLLREWESWWSDTDAWVADVHGALRHAFVRYGQRKRKTILRSDPVGTRPGDAGLLHGQVFTLKLRAQSLLEDIPAATASKDCSRISGHQECCSASNSAATRPTRKERLRTFGSRKRTISIQHFAQCLIASRTLMTTRCPECARSTRLQGCCAMFARAI